MNLHGLLPQEAEAIAQLAAEFADELEKHATALDAALAVPAHLFGKRVAFRNDAEIDKRVFQVTFSLYAKAVKTHRAIGLLARHGLGQDALAMCRVLFETAVAIGFLLERDHRQRTDLYEAFEANKHLQMVRAWAELPVSKADPETPGRLQMAQASFDAVRDRVGMEALRTATRHWSGADLRATCERMGLLPLYEIVFRYSSLAIHAADGPAHATVESERIELRLIPGRTYIKEALQYANQSILYAAAAINGTFPVGCDDLLAKATAAVFDGRPSWVLQPLPEEHSHRE